MLDLLTVACGPFFIYPYTGLSNNVKKNILASMVDLVAVSCSPIAIYWLYRVTQYCKENFITIPKKINSSKDDCLLGALFRIPNTQC